MKFLLMPSFVVMMAFFVCGCDNPTSNKKILPDPEPIEQEEDYDIEIIEQEGILTLEALWSGGDGFDYWRLSTKAGFAYLVEIGEVMIFVYVRGVGTEYEWEVPLWTLKNQYIYIYDDDVADLGYQYKIVIAY